VSDVFFGMFDLEVSGEKVQDFIMVHSSCFNLDSVITRRCKERSYMDPFFIGVLLGVDTEASPALPGASVLLTGVVMDLLGFVPDLLAVGPDLPTRIHEDENSGV